MSIEPLHVQCPDCDSPIEHALPPGGTVDPAWGDVPDGLLGADVRCDRCGNGIGVYVFDPGAEDDPASRSPRRSPPRPSTSSR